MLPTQKIHATLRQFWVQSSEQNAHTVMSSVLELARVFLLKSWELGLTKSWVSDKDGSLTRLGLTKLGLSHKVGSLTKLILTKSSLTKLSLSQSLVSQNAVCCSDDSRVVVLLRQPVHVMSNPVKKKNNTIFRIYDHNLDIHFSLVWVFLKYLSDMARCMVGKCFFIWLNCYCWVNWSMAEGRFSKWI